jgi:hypothetical protein
VFEEARIKPLSRDSVNKLFAQILNYLTNYNTRLKTG